MGKPTTEDILGFMDDEENAVWNSPKTTQEERDKLRKSLEEEWQSLPDPTIDDLKHPFMYIGTWQTYQSGANQEQIFNSEQRRWKKLRRKPKTQPPIPSKGLDSPQSPEPEAGWESDKSVSEALAEQIERERADAEAKRSEPTQEQIERTQEALRLAKPAARQFLREVIEYRQRKEARLLKRFRVSKARSSPTMERFFRDIVRFRGHVDWFKPLWSWTGLGIICTAIWGAGLAAMFGDQYVIAICAFTATFGFLAIKGIVEAKHYERAVLIVVLAIMFLGSHVAWAIYTHKQLERARSESLKR